MRSVHTFLFGLDELTFISITSLPVQAILKLGDFFHLRLQWHMLAILRREFPDAAAACSIKNELLLLNRTCSSLWQSLPPLLTLLYIDLIHSRCLQKSRISVPLSQELIPCTPNQIQGLIPPFSQNLRVFIGYHYSPKEACSFTKLPGYSGTWASQQWGISFALCETISAGLLKRSI